MTTTRTLRTTLLSAPGIRFAYTDVSGKELARARLYFHENDLHDRPYAYVEDVFVDPAARGQRLAKAIMQEMVAEARRRNCYKIVAGSRYDRPWVHKIYLDLGFTDHGKEFRMNL